MRCNHGLGLAELPQYLQPKSISHCACVHVVESAAIAQPILEIQHMCRDQGVLHQALGKKPARSNISAILDCLRAQRSNLVVGHQSDLVTLILRRDHAPFATIQRDIVLQASSALRAASAMRTAALRNAERAALRASTAMRTNALRAIALHAALRAITVV